MSFHILDQKIENLNLLFRNFNNLLSDKNKNFQKLLLSIIFLYIKKKNKFIYKKSKKSTIFNHI